MGVEKEWYLKKMGQEAVKALRKNGFDATFLEDRQELISKLRGLIQPGSSAGFGGSRTLAECSVFDWLREEEAQARLDLFDRDEPGISLEEKKKRMINSLHADYFFAGINGIGLDGSLVFIDAYGNRVAPILYGPKHVILVSGANKVTPTKETALVRAKEVAAPLNSYRLKKATPCAETGHCHNCRSEQRICNYTVLLERDSDPGRIKVFIIGEELGL